MHFNLFDVRSFKGDGFVTDHLLVVSEVRGYFQQVNGQYRSLNLRVPQNAGSFLDSSETGSC